jgi:phenylpropionate dioxygenase-like ring-hydroxylating dioxygenase large terminal subunit
MDRTTEIALLRRCLVQNETNTTTLMESEALSPVERYLDEQRFLQELEVIHRRLPVPYIHSSELAQADSFRRVNTNLGDVLFTRDQAGAVHAFHNVCRHRGASLTLAESGSARRLVCPYHAWSYAADGELVSVPGADLCFPNLERGAMGLKAIPCVERYGLVWLCPGAQDRDREHAAQELEDHLGDMSTDLQWLDIDQLQLFKRNTRRWKANWKLLSEGGQETYHFKAAHKNTIGPYFLNNLSVQDSIGGHSRVPIGQGGMTEDERRHWDTNLKITLTTLDEDFEIGEGIQRGLVSGANSALTFGRSEGTLKEFNDWVERTLAE